MFAVQAEGNLRISVVKFESHLTTTSKVDGLESTDFFGCSFKSQKSMLQGDVHKRLQKP